MQVGWRTALGLVVLAFALGAALANAPVVLAEADFALAPLHARLIPPTPPGFAARPGPAAGAVVDGYWRVQQISPDTFAIGEPQDDPDNYEYLLLGRDRALLIDSGSTSRDIHPALASITGLPVTVIPTHLHSDHTNGLRWFGAIALVDLPQTRARLREGQVHLGRYQYMAPGPAPVFAVSTWIRPGLFADLGGRRVQLLWTPGHTATSISIYDPTEKLLFTGDYIYPTSLYAFMPDSSLAAYEATADRLLLQLPAGTRIYGAHCCRNDLPPQAPWLTMGDLKDVRGAVHAIRFGQAKGQGVLLRRFPVNARMTLLTLYPFGDR